MSERGWSEFAVAVVGSQGMLARETAALLERSGFEVVGLDVPDIDITREESIQASFSNIERLGLLINCAAYTAVDRAESEPAPAFAVNRDGAKNLASYCDRRGIPLIHFSTDYIFDGLSANAYLETDAPGALSVYGQSKLEGEQAVRSTMSEWLIVRTAWLYGYHGQNFVKTIIRLAREREELRIVADQRGCPTWAHDLAGAVTRMAQRIAADKSGVAWGVYNYCGAGETTWCGFAEAIVEEARRYESLKALRIVPIETDDYPVAAKRPAWSVLDCGKIRRQFGIEPPHWRKSLAMMIEELYSSR